MAMRDPIPRKWTIDEWLAYEEETHTRYEYINGDIYAMSGGTEEHNIISGNIFGELRNQLRDSSCHTFNPDMRVKINDEKFVYPDVSVVCGKRDYADEKRTMLINPILVVEVFSPTSTQYDFVTKAEYYKSLPSVQAYLLVDQSRVYTQLQVRSHDAWTVYEFTQLDDVIPLTMINCKLPLSEVYLDINFE